MGLHFKTDVFAAVAVVDAKAPYLFSLRTYLMEIEKKPEIEGEKA